MTILLRRLLNGRPMLISIPGTSSSSSSALPVALSLTNSKSTAVAAGAPITIGHSFAPGDVPAGSSVAISGMAVQQDQESYWPDGSLRFAALALRDTARSYGINGGGADTQSMSVSTASSPPNRTAAFTLAQYLAANDHKILFSGLDCGANTFAISPATIVANGTAAPWDTGPLALPNGAAQGATTITVADATHVSIGQSVSPDGRTQKALYSNSSAFAFVTAVSGTTVTLSAGLPSAIPSGGTLWFNTPICGWETVRSGPNCMEWKFWSFLRASGGTNDGRYHCQIRATLYVRAWGINGPFEIEALIENPNSFGNHPYATLGPTTATGPVRFSCNAALYNGATLLYAWGGGNDRRATTIPASSITNQSGVATITPALPSGANLFHRGCGIQFGTAAGGTLPPGLAVNTGYWTDGNDFGASTSSIIKTDRAFADGFTSADVTITGTGTGTINVWPTLAIFGASGENLATNTAEPVWDAGHSALTIRPHLMPSHDKAYLVTSKAVLPFDWSRTALPRTSCKMSDRGTYADLSTFYPGQFPTWGTKISQYGDDPGDDRVGFIRQIEAELYFNQTNVNSDMMLRSSARRFWEYSFVIRNERSAAPLAHSVTAYSGLGPATVRLNVGPDLQGSAGQYYPFQSAANGGIDWSGIENTYGPQIDASHLPCMGAGPYQRYGHRIFLDQMQLACGTLMFCSPYWTATQNGTTYGPCPMTEHSEQTRGLGWRMKYFSQAEYYSPGSGDLYAPYLTDMINVGSNYLNDWLASHDTWKDTIGLFNVGSSDTNQSMYMSNFLALSIAMVVWRDIKSTRPGYRNFLANHFYKFVLNTWDIDQGGGMAFINKGPFQFTATIGDITTVAQNPTQLWSINGISQTNTGAIDNTDGSNSFRGNYPFDTDVYGTIAFDTWAMLAWIGIPKAQTLCDRLHAILANPPYKPIVWSQPAGYYYNDNSTPQAFMPWCVRPPSGSSL